MPQTFTVGSRSLFVNAVAWLALLAALLLVGSAALGFVPAPSSVAHGSGQALAAAPQGLAAGLAGLWHDLLPWAQAAALVLAAITVAAAIGLLRRHEGARRVFVVLLGVAVVLNLASLGLQQALVLWLVQATLAHAVLPQAVAPVFDGLVVATRSMSAVVTLGLCAVLAVVAWRLGQPMIRQEFAAA